jgi:hypothetical protein
VPTSGAPDPGASEAASLASRSVLPASRRKEPGQRRKKSPIGWPKRRPWLLATEHDKLMPQNEQFDVLGELATPASGKQAQHRRNAR